MNQQRPPAAAPTESDARLESERDRGDAALWAKLAETPDLLHAIQQAQHVDPFALQRQLRTVFSPELVRSALLLTDLRKRAAEKFSAADKMWFDRLGYEQSTGEAVARHKSLRFRQNPGLVWDLCCGIGADAMILAEEQSVVAVDRRETACQLTRLNLATTPVACCRRKSRAAH